MALQQELTMFFHPDLKTQMDWNRILNQHSIFARFAQRQALAIKRAKAYREHGRDPVAEITAVLNKIGYDPSQDDDWRYR